MRDNNLMTRNRRSAKAAGARFERIIADFLKVALDNEYIDRKVRTGSLDTGDIGGVRAHGQRVAVECKDTARIDLPAWTKEAHVEAVNDRALVGVVIHKRHGVGDPGQQWVSMTVNDFVALITGKQHQEEGSCDE